MQGLVVEGGKVSLQQGLPAPEPGPGQVLVRPLLCGICGSDLHSPQLQIADPGSWPDRFVLGHEYVAEIIDYGPKTERRFPIGAKVGSVPYVDGIAEPQLLGFSGEFPGALSEAMLLQEDRLVEVRADTPIEAAVLAEPLAVGFHAVAQTDVRPGDAVLVIGCGPVGLSVIAALRAAGLGPIIASDYSPKRRELAEALGVDVVLDPAQQDPYTSWIERAGADLPPSPLLSVPGRAPSVLFDCVGLPGLLQQHIDSAPPHSQIINVGVCMVPDPILPVVAIMKELSMKFVFAYTADEYQQAMQAIIDGKVDVAPWVTAERPLAEAEAAFVDLAQPAEHCKVVIRSTG